MEREPKVEYRVERKNAKRMNGKEIIQVLLSQENALSKLKDELENTEDLDELFNSSEKAVLQHYISNSENQLKTIREAIKRRLKALKANNKYW